MENKIKIIFIFLCVATFFSSCITNKDLDYLQDIKLKYPEAIVSPEEYKIIPGDQLQIVVYTIDEKTRDVFSGYVPRFSGQGINDRTSADLYQQARGLDDASGVSPVAVYADGTITFPYIGSLYVQGMTLLEVRETISAKLDAFADGTTAEVSLYNRFFSILGEAESNRVLMPKTSMTIFEALTLGGALGPYADRSKVTILRQTDTGVKTRMMDIRSIDIIDTEFYYIQPNDVIYVPQLKRKFLGSTTSFAGAFGLVTSLAGVIIFTLRVF